MIKVGTHVDQWKGTQQSLRERMKAIIQKVGENFVQVASLCIKTNFKVF